MTEASDEAPEGEKLPPYAIESARSSRSRCRTCRKHINKQTLRLGILLEGPYGTGYLWHHLACAARRRLEDVEAAYAQRAWAEGLNPPPLEELRGLNQEAEERRASKKQPPYVERAPTGRSRCKHCGEPIEHDAFRFVLARTVAFGNQVRAAPTNVHARCVAAELASEECCVELDGFADAVRAGSDDLAPEEVERALAEVGPLG